MKRKFALISVTLLAALSIIAGGGMLLVSHEPDFYREALGRSVVPEVRQAETKRFVQTALQLVGEIQNDEEFVQEFSDEALNGWLAEELPEAPLDWLPPELESLRVKFEDDAVLVGLRARWGRWSGVVNACVRVRVGGANQLVLEIQSLRAGLVPVPADEVLGKFVDRLNRAGWNIEWKHTGEKDLLVVSLDQKEFTRETSTGRAALESIDVRPGWLRVSGARRP
jgi:hypothetical protein